ncbi:hypothetical protein [Nostoc sp.]|uniref:hypothetical protein n=1 Tax=Nostoc sp. TaxID=1180 RepID=UPI002FFA221A
MNNFSLSDDVTVLEIKVFMANSGAIACCPERLRFLTYPKKPGCDRLPKVSFNTFNHK